MRSGQQSDERSHANHPASGMCSRSRPVRCRRPTVSYRAGVGGRGAAHVDGHRARAKQMTTLPHSLIARVIEVGSRGVGRWKLSAGHQRPPIYRGRGNT